MNIFKNISSGWLVPFFIIFALYFLLCISLVHAEVVAESAPESEMPESVSENEIAGESTLIRVATVNAYNVSISKQEEGILEVTYEAHNREGVQTGIVSSITLTDSKGFLAQRHISTETFSLGVNEQKTRVDRMNISPHLSGEFNVAFALATQSGLLLAQASAGKITLSGTGEYIHMQGCALSVSNESDTYSAHQGVDVRQDEELVAKCLIKNLSSKSMTVTPHLQEYWRSFFGEKIAEYASIPITIGSEAEMTVDIPIQKNTKPQAYTQTLIFMDEGGNPVSTQFDFHYVVRGEGATIQNIVFDKPSYNEGDTAKVSFGFTGSADSFLGARVENGTGVSGVAVFEMRDGNDMCAQAQEMPFDTQDGAGYTHKELSILVEKKCMNPTLSVTVKDSTGNVLDARQVTGDRNDDVVVSNQEAVHSDSLATRIILGFVIIACMLVAGILAYMLRKRSATSFFPLLFLVTVFCGMGCFSKEVMADTFLFDITADNSVPYAVTVNHNKANYAPGETVWVTSSITSSACWNGWNAQLGVLRVLSPENVLINTWNISNFSNGALCTYIGDFMGHAHYQCDSSGSAGFNAGMVTGARIADYRLRMTVNKGVVLVGDEFFSMPYNVVAPVPVCGTAHQRTMTGSAGPTTEGWTLCTSGVQQNHEPDGYALVNGGVWMGWDWDCLGSGSRYCFACRPNYISNGSTCVPACTVSSWSPSPSTVCSGQPFMQTSNCGTTQWNVGTMSCSPTLSVGVTANPISGSVPLSSNITANLGGTATGDATYRFDCDNDGTYEHTQTTGANSLSYTCTYSTPGTTFTPRVNVTRQTATNSGTATVTTNPSPPTVFFSADNLNVPANARTRLRWRSLGATSCTASGAWSGARGDINNQPYSELTDPLTTGAHTYILTCSNAGGSTPESVTITAAPPLKPQ